MRDCAPRLICLVLWLLSSVALAAQQPLSEQQWSVLGAALGGAVEQERQAQGIPSVAIAIVAPKAAGWRGTFGFIDAQKSQPADIHSRYRTGALIMPEDRSTRLQAPSGEAAQAGVVYAEMAPYDDVRLPAPADAETGAHSSAYSLDELAALAASALTRGTPAGAPAAALDGHRVLQREGASYGYVSELASYPDEGFAVVVLVALDQAHPALTRLRNFAARLVFAARSGGAAPHYPAPSQAPPAELSKKLAGHYVHGPQTLEVRIVEDRTYLEAPQIAAELRRRGAKWLLDDVLTYREDVSIEGTERITVAGVSYRRAAQVKPAPPDAALEALFGAYGHSYDYLRIYERDGRGWLRIGPADYEPLERLSTDLYRVGRNRPGRTLQVLRAADGTARAVKFDERTWPRHDFGAEAEATVHAMVRDVPGLRENAWRASPPVQPAGLRAPELIEVVHLEPAIKLDINYARRDNFMGLAVYDEPRAFMQRPAAEALVRAHRHLARDYGFGILIHDTYRPWAVTKMFWDATPPAAHDFVADPAEGSKHNRGCAADITLYDLKSGATLVMPGRYDETSARSTPLYIGGSSLERWRRDVLKAAVEAEGFDVYRFEWWHFDFHLWREYPVLNLNFKDIPAPPVSH